MIVDLERRLSSANRLAFSLAWRQDGRVRAYSSPFRIICCKIGSDKSYMHVHKGAPLHV